MLWRSPNGRCVTRPIRRVFEPRAQASDSDSSSEWKPSSYIWRSTMSHGGCETADPACAAEKHWKTTTIPYATSPPPAHLKKAHCLIGLPCSIWYLPWYEADRQYGGAVEQCKTSRRAMFLVASPGIQSTVRRALSRGYRGRGAPRNVEVRRKNRLLSLAV
jgi:hypothetical protein